MEYKMKNRWSTWFVFWKFFPNNTEKIWSCKPSRCLEKIMWTLNCSLSRIYKKSIKKNNDQSSSENTICSNVSFSFLCLLFFWKERYSLEFNNLFNSIWVSCLLYCSNYSTVILRLSVNRFSSDYTVWFCMIIKTKVMTIEKKT